MKNCPSGPCAYCTMVAPVAAEVVEGLALVMVRVCKPWDTLTPSELDICIVPAGRTGEEKRGVTTTSGPKEKDRKREKAYSKY